MLLPSLEPSQQGGSNKGPQNVFFYGEISQQNIHIMGSDEYGQIDY